MNVRIKKQEYRPKMSKTEQKIEIDVETLSGYLNEGGYNILSYFEMSKDELMDILVKKQILNHKNKISKLEIDSYFTF